MGGLKAAVEIDRPLAGDIVRDFDVVHLTTLEIFGDNVIGVDISKTQSALSCAR